MSIGIYKIQNLINKKIYIGQSVHIEIRWMQHCKPSSHSLISQSIKKYGKENFSFEIIKLCSKEQLNFWETFYIKQYNSLVPNGYNIILEDENHLTSFNKYDSKQFQQIINDIKNSSLSFQDIAQKYSLNVRMIYFLNKGDHHFLENETYPLRPVQNVKKHYYCIDCGKEISKGALRCEKCGHLKQRKCDERPSKDQLKFLIRSLPFTKIGEKYNVTDNSIRKWCKTYNLPYQKTKIKTFSDQEWEKI